jgi:hypothetical protein
MRSIKSCRSCGQIPQSIKLNIFFDRTQSIRESVRCAAALIGTILWSCWLSFSLRNVCDGHSELGVAMSIVGTFAVVFARLQQITYH